MASAMDANARPMLPTQTAPPIASHSPALRPWLVLVLAGLRGGLLLRCLGQLDGGERHLYGGRVDRGLSRTAASALSRASLTPSTPGRGG